MTTPSIPHRIARPPSRSPEPSIQFNIARDSRSQRNNANSRPVKSFDSNGRLSKADRIQPARVIRDPGEKLQAKEGDESPPGKPINGEELAQPQAGALKEREVNPAR